MFELVMDAESSRYSMSLEQCQEFTHWLDLVAAASEPEDVTTLFFVDNFVDDEKAHQLTDAGFVTATLYRYAYEATMLTDVVIEGDEIYETNAKKGIFIDISDPGPGEYYSEYQIQLFQPEYQHPRYRGRVMLHLTPPHRENPAYAITYEAQLNRGIKSKAGSDFVKYSIDPDAGIIDANIAVDPVDMPRGIITPRPLTQEDLDENHLNNHVQFIANVMGIAPPDFIDC